MALEKVCLTKTSLIDFPGEVAALVFTPGCNLRCPYCHNPELVSGPIPEEALTLEALDLFLEKRSSVLGGVVITGGEPALHRDLPELVKRIRSHGYKIKLDTNGTFPERLEDLPVDYIAMDIKTSPGSYHLVGLNDPSPVIRSADWIMKSGIPYEFRTTLVPGIISENDIQDVADLIRGCKKYILSRFRPKDTLDPDYEKIPPYSDDVIEMFARKFRSLGIPARVRES